MDTGILLINVWALIGLAILILVPKLIWPEATYIVKSSLILAWMGAIVFAFEFLVLVFNEDYSDSFVPLIACIVCVYFIYLGGRNVAYKTMTGVFSGVSNQPIGRKRAGAFNWVDPVLEKTTISTDGKPNVSADLQELTIELAETPDMQTAKRGITAKIKDTIFVLHLDENKLRLAFRIEGGLETIRFRIQKFILGFYIDKIGVIDPTDLDTDKENTIQELAGGLKKDVNAFCKRNDYPYEISEEVTIGDIVLTDAYYTVLGKTEFARLEQEAKNLESVELGARIVALGKKLLPSGTEAEQQHAAKVALGIVTESNEKKTYSLDSDTLKGLEPIARIFKGL